jgi:glycosyltransferase involved in cell wall biosynthesis
MPLQRLFFVLPLPYSPDGGFWPRDCGLLVRVLREKGYDAWLAALGDDSTPTEGQPVIAAPLEKLASAAWWKAQKPDGIVFTGWSAPRFDGIRRAALAATPRVVERLDTAGFRSARLFPRRYFEIARIQYTDAGRPGFRSAALPLALARTALCYAFPRLMDVPMARTMGQLPGLIAESPIAAQNIRRMIERFAPPAPRIEVIPHPVNTADVHSTGAPKENLLVSVGRWEARQKDFPMLHRVLRGFLEKHPDWRAIIVGGGVPHAIAHFATRERWEERVTFAGRLEHAELGTIYNRARIYLMASREESFCIAAAEALSCGASVVGSDAVPSSSYFAEFASGRVAAPRSCDAFCRALDQEVRSWENGERDPAAIAREWTRRVGADQVAARTVEFLESIPSR